MLYLSGTWSEEIASEVRRVRTPVGPLVTPATHSLPTWYMRTSWLGAWAADNGCYAQGDSFDLGRYLAWLDRLKWWSVLAIFATAPDVVGDAAATWKRSEPVLSLLRRMGYAAALVAQDGFDEHAVDWDAFDVLFLGGSTEWKERGSGPAAQAAWRHGKWLHMGRVNSERRMVIAERLGCWSCDGNFLAFGSRSNLPRLQRMLLNSKQQPDLFRLTDRDRRRPADPQPSPEIRTNKGHEMKALAVLKKLEWSISDWGAHRCPDCYSRKDQGHKPGCELAEAKQELESGSVEIRRVA